jgi:beta-glucosidase
VRLRPGESRRVEVTLPGRAFAYWHTGVAGWRVPSGTFGIEVARSSVDVVAVVPVEIHGDAGTAPDGPDTPPIAATDEQFAARLGHAVPEPRPVRPFTRQSSLEELTVTRIGRLLHAVLWRIAPFDDETRADEAGMRMYKRALEELPLRGAAIYSGRKLTLTTVDTLLDILNGRPRQAAVRSVAALGRTIRSWLR